jgi:uncharacterized protein YciI
VPLKEELVKFLVICSPRGQSSADRLAALVPDEADALRELKSEGTLVDAWSPGRPGAVLIIEAASESDADGVVARLPLAVAGLIETTLTPLYDLRI